MDTHDQRILTKQQRRFDNFRREVSSFSPSEMKRAWLTQTLHFVWSLWGGSQVKTILKFQHCDSVHEPGWLGWSNANQEAFLAPNSPEPMRRLSILASD